LQRCQDERDRSQTRIVARKLAEERYSRAEKEHEAANDEERQRANAAQRLIEAQDALVPAKEALYTSEQAIKELEGKQAQRRTALSERRDEQRALQQRASHVAARLEAMDDMDRLNIAKSDLQRVEGISGSVDDLKRYVAQNPVPDKRKQDELKVTRLKIMKLQAACEAASMILRVAPEERAGPAQLAVDGGPFRELVSDLAPATHSVRRKAELHIPAWGRVELSRGSSDGDIDQIEADLRRCHEGYTAALASFGIAASELDAFDQLLRRIAEHGLKSKELQAKEQELKRIAPKGLEPLQRRVLELETRLKDMAVPDPDDAEPMPSEREGLEELRADLNARISDLDHQIRTIQKEVDGLESDLSVRRGDVARSREKLAGLEATANSRQEELGRLRGGNEVAGRIEQAKRDLAAARDELKRSELTPEESTVEERLAACKEAVKALENQTRENDEKYNRIKGRLEVSEGLHAERASLAARVDELTRLTSRESLEKDAVDRLYELFEECREKQLGTLMGPIHDRVLNWMRVLEIGDYKEVRFCDEFLPERLVRRDGTAELSIDEESTGAQEQISMLVRVALGSLLTSDKDPAVAILDDPLTHCDVGRLNKMRVILRRAAVGDSRLSPPAGPLQIIILTCHPEWFRDEQATVIDLEDLEVMRRLDV
jgi:predicted  nucleic acid-binding Zn-ribbon protein